MKKFTFNLKIALVIALSSVLMAFSVVILTEEDRVFIKQVLNKYYNIAGAEAPLKSYEINVTNTGFCKYKKIFASGKEEFYAFNLAKFKSLEFTGSTEDGKLCFYTKNDDVIVQTRNDKTGNVDSMATYVIIPVKNMDTDELNQLSIRLKKLNPNLATSNR